MKKLLLSTLFLSLYFICQAQDSILIKTWLEFQAEHYDSEGHYNDTPKYDLLTPNPNDILICWCDYDFIYYNPKTRKNSKIKYSKIKNYYHEAYIVGSFLTVQEQFIRY
jgi:hypothetical protein